MRRLIGMMLFALPTAAAAECQGRADLLTVEEWSVEKVSGPVSGIDITIHLKSGFDKPFRMIDAGYTFSDALGRRISGFTMNPDLRASPNETVETGNGYTGREMDRVLTMNRDDVSVSTCVRAVVYEDGTKEKFN